MGQIGIQSNGQRYGVQITGYGTIGNVVDANRIGTDITGTIALGNVAAGVEIDSGAANNAIGSLTTAGGIFYGFNFASAIASADLALQSEVSAPSATGYRWQPGRGLPSRRGDGQPAHGIRPCPGAHDPADPPRFSGPGARRERWHLGQRSG